ncbi:hypothetical protein [Rhizobium sp. L1K21]|uniref:hypothetical protein n=1 Tax=Rhizobium sp. L1K21 TaxID=2954933 RepID=UPI0020930F94|nr:hypothetical protein [Rhizobium sp. L1K21]MCO6186993.1 hypothetical protein [Rhizobium sp. L1K21]
MLLEAAHYTLAMALSKRRKADEVRDAVSLWSRARRCFRAWRPHEEACRVFVRDHVEKMAPRRTVAVLGSGLLRDVPMNTLSKMFDKVYLYDLVHLPSVRLRAFLRGWRNVEFVECDLADEVNLDFLKKMPDVDLVISANLLSQMTVELLDDGLRLEAEDLARAHMANLFMGPWKGCLLSDIIFEEKDRQGAVIKSGDLLAGVEPPAADQIWHWTVVPFGEVDDQHETVHTVIAVWK